MKPILALVAALAVAGCGVVGPDYEAPPQLDLEPRFAFAGGDALHEAATDAWWTALGDPALDDFMREGLMRNFDVRIARERIEESAALARTAGVLQSQVAGDFEASSIAIESDGISDTSEQAGVNGTFVFDLFGRAFRGRQQAQANLDATIFSAAQARLAYQAEMADAVTQARFFQAARSATNRTIRSRQRILASTRDLLESGQVTRNDLVRARAQVAQAQANLPRFEEGLRISAVRIAVLLNRPTGPILHRLEQSGNGQPAPNRRVSAGHPADLLRNRPDIQAAERRLAASFAALGVAHADLYPTLSLDGTISIDSTETFTLGPRLTVPVLGRWRLLAQREAAQSRALQAELAWRGAIRSAVGDVERALVQIQSAEAQSVALVRARDNFRTLFSLSQETFTIGDTTLLELLDTEQDIQSAEISLAAARRDLALGYARLSVATGRGSAVGVDPVRPPEMVVASVEAAE